MHVAKLAVTLSSALAAVGTAPAWTVHSQASRAPMPRTGASAPCLRPARAARVLSLRRVEMDAGSLMVASVCVEHRGPFPFVVDSGSSMSVVATSLAARLGLTASGPARSATGIRCREKVTPTALRSWSIGGIALAPQTVLRGSLPRLAGVEVDGLIGSDVLSRFGAVRIDYRAETLTLAGPEGKPLGGGAARLLRGSGDPTPGALRVGVRLSAPLVVAVGKGAVAVGAMVRLHGVRHFFVVDTGSIVSAVSSSVARADHLIADRGEISLAAVGCRATMREARLASWSLGSAHLAAQLVGVIPAGGLPVDGILGSDLFSRYGAVVIDYRDARLLLERG